MCNIHIAYTKTPDLALPVEDELEVVIERDGVVHREPLVPIYSLKSPIFVPLGSRIKVIVVTSSSTDAVLVRVNRLVLNKLVGYGEWGRSYEIEVKRGDGLAYQASIQEVQTVAPFSSIDEEVDIVNSVAVHLTSKFMRCLNENLKKFEKYTNDLKAQLNWDKFRSLIIRNFYAKVRELVEGKAEKLEAIAKEWPISKAVVEELAIENKAILDVLMANALYEVAIIFGFRYVTKEQFSEKAIFPIQVELTPLAVDFVNSLYFRLFPEFNVKILDFLAFIEDARDQVTKSKVEFQVYQEECRDLFCRQIRESVKYFTDKDLKKLIDKGIDEEVPLDTLNNMLTSLQTEIFTKTLEKMNQNIDSYLPPHIIAKFTNRSLEQPLPANGGGGGADDKKIDQALIDELRSYITVLALQLESDESSSSEAEEAEGIAPFQEIRLTPSQNNIVSFLTNRFIDHYKGVVEQFNILLKGHISPAMTMNWDKHASFCNEVFNQKLCEAVSRMSEEKVKHIDSTINEVIDCIDLVDSLVILDDPSFLQLVYFYSLKGISKNYAIDTLEVDIKAIVISAFDSLVNSDQQVLVQFIKNDLSQVHRIKNTVQGFLRRVSKQDSIRILNDSNLYEAFISEFQRELSTQIEKFAEDLGALKINEIFELKKALQGVMSMEELFKEMLPKTYKLDILNNVFEKIKQKSEFFTHEALPSAVEVEGIERLEIYFKDRLKNHFNELLEALFDSVDAEELLAAYTSQNGKEGLFKNCSSCFQFYINDSLSKVKDITPIIKMLDLPEGITDVRHLIWVLPEGFFNQMFLAILNQINRDYRLKVEYFMLKDIADKIAQLES